MHERASRSELLDGAADAICGQTTEPRKSVVAALADVAELVAEVDTARDQPDVKRATVRKNLESVRRHAVLPRWALTRPSTIFALQRTSSSRMPLRLDAGETDIAPHLQALAARTKQALKRMPSHQGGTEGFRNSRGLTTKQFAAVAIVEIYKRE